MATSDNEWQRVKTNDNEWQSMTASGITKKNKWEQLKQNDFKFPEEFYSIFMKYVTTIYSSV